MATNNVELKIQVKHKGQSELDGLPWADLDEAMPEFHDYGAAHQWLVDNDLMRLTHHGLSFRIVPADLPCDYSAQLERKLASSNGGEQ